MYSIDLTGWDAPLTCYNTAKRCFSINKCSLCPSRNLSFWLKDTNSLEDDVQAAQRTNLLAQRLWFCCKLSFNPCDLVFFTVASLKAYSTWRERTFTHLNKLTTPPDVSSRRGHPRACTVARASRCRRWRLRLWCRSFFFVLLVDLFRIEKPTFNDTQSFLVVGS